MQSTGPRIYLTRSGFWARFWPLLQSASVAAYKDNCLGIAKGAAYSSLLAFFPVITTVATLLVLARADAVSRAIANLLYDVVPPGTEDVVRTLFIVHGQRPKWLLVVATMLSAFAASGAMISLMEGFRAVYRIPTGRPMLQERGIALALVFISAIPVLGASALIVFGGRTERMLVNWMNESDLSGWLVLGGQILRYVAALAAFVVVTAMIYYFGINRKQKLRNVFPGAVLATVLWLLATIVFGWYVRNIGNYNVLYGSVGAGLALLVWMYVLAVITLLGCEFNAARERFKDG